VGPLPLARVVLDSALSPEALSERLASRVDPQLFLGPNTAPTVKPYEGWVEGGAFRIRPVWRRGRNSFRVVVAGSIEPRGPGSRLRATLRMDAPALVLPALAAAVLLVGTHARAWLRGSEPPGWTWWLVALSMAALGWLMLLAFFWAGEAGARRFLAEVAGGAPADPVSPPR